MKRSLGALLLCLGLTADAEAGQQALQIPAEKAHKFGEVLMRIEAALPARPLALTGDPQKASGVVAAGGEVAAVWVPQRKRGNDDDPPQANELTPLGLLCLRGLVPAVEGKPVLPARLQTQDFPERQARLVFLYVARRNGGDAPEYVVFSADDKPLLTLTAEAVEPASKSPEVLCVDEVTPQGATLLAPIPGGRCFPLPVTVDATTQPTPAAHEAADAGQ